MSFYVYVLVKCSCGMAVQLLCRQERTWDACLYYSMVLSSLSGQILANENWRFSACYYLPVLIGWNSDVCSCFDNLNLGEQFLSLTDPSDQLPDHETVGFPIYSFARNNLGGDCWGCTASRRVLDFSIYNSKFVYILNDNHDHCTWTVLQKCCL